MSSTRPAINRVADNVIVLDSDDETEVVGPTALPGLALCHLVFLRPATSDAAG